MSPVLIIGATSQVASDVARIYASRGRQLILVARNHDKLQRLKAELGTCVVATHVLDFEDFDAITPLVTELHERHGSFGLALLAHGYLGNQVASESDWTEARKQMDVNFASAVAWLIPLAERMESDAHGHLAVLSSVAGDRGRPRNYTYGASKGALTLYMQGLRSRLYGKVPVTTIKLGPVDTPMTRDHQKNASFTTSERAAEAIVRALNRRRGEVYVPGYWRAVLLAVRVMPQPLFQRLKFLSGR